MGIPTPVKSVLGHAMARLDPRCSYERLVVVIGHMRCGTTALSNVLCAHPAIAGFGEAHIAYDGSAAPGVLALSIRRRGALKPEATRLFDKILHDRYDRDADPRFFDAAAIFVARSPSETVPSIRKLFREIGSDEFGTDELAARYLAERMETMRQLWDRFGADRRIFLSHDGITGDPDAALSRISAILALHPALENRYASGQVVRRGAGDPLSASRFDRIVPKERATNVGGATGLAIGADLEGRLSAAYAALLALEDRG